VDTLVSISSNANPKDAVGNPLLFQVMIKNNPMVFPGAFSNQVKTLVKI
jgi:hypothetical protein